jgi:hypothetical protein
MSRRLPRPLAATVAAILAGLLATPLVAQQRDETPPAELTDEAAAELLAVFNRVTTVRLNGESVLPAGTELNADLGVLGGPLVLAGRVSGDVIVINGDLRFEPGAEVGGNVTVVGGMVHGLQAARVAGRVTVYRQPLRYHSEGGLIVRVPPPEKASGLTTGRDFRFGRSDLTLAVRGAYNRVEGLPIAAGARLELGRSNPTIMEAVGIYRTESGLRLRDKDLGYALRIEQHVGGRRAARIGLALRSEVRPIEDWGLSDRESSLAAFVLHRDFRDHYERTGWAGYVRIAPRNAPFSALLELRDEKHTSIPAGDPLSLFDNGREWRPQPVVAEGDLTSVVARFAYDTRNEPLEPSTGWYIAVEAELGLAGDLTMPIPAIPGSDVPVAGRRAVDHRFRAALVDVRRYARTGPGSRLAIRALVAGSLDGGPLPPQRQHALGGEGSLPGYSPFQFDCGARRARLNIFEDDALVETPYFPYYGCDRMALVQIEYQVRLPLPHDLDRRLAGVDLGPPPSWGVFFDAGRAWNEENARQWRGAGQNDFAADAGFGLRLGRIGMYWAVPLSGGAEGVNFFVRVAPRF